MKVIATLFAAVLLIAAAPWVMAQSAPASTQPRRPPHEAPLPPEVRAAEKLSVILGRPTDKSVTVSILSAGAGEACVEYGIAAGTYTLKTPMQAITSNVPLEITLDNLAANTRYFYRIRHLAAGDAAFTVTDEKTFHAQRTPGSTFTFEIQGDSHPERPQMFDPNLYAQVLRAAAADRPDFYFLLGDDFSVDTLRTISADTVRPIYLRQRYFLNLLGVPVYLVNGNHEQAAGVNLDGTPTSVGAVVQNARNLYFPQPAPDNFYTGDTRKVPHIGLLRDYHAFTWGDALFVVIDPYWHSKAAVDNLVGTRERANRSLWDVSIGDEQYAWLKKTLEDSKAKHRFVFAHHILGTTRGGIERAGQFEWGGKNNRGDDEFAQRRPNWPLPIHQLMVKNHVTIFFQGHDHIYAHQSLDGVTYQTLPVPADSSYALMNKDAYANGVTLPGSGRLRVTVSPEKVRVEYIRSYLPKDATPDHPDGEIAHRYELPETAGK